MMKRIYGIILLAVLLCASAGGFFAVRWYLDNRAPLFRQDAELYVYPDKSVDEILEDIKANADPRRMGSLRRMFRKENVEEKKKPGRYEIKKGETAVYLARAITRGWQNPVNVCLSGRIRTKEDLASKLSAQLMADSVEFIEAMADSAFLATLGFTPSGVFGMIVPDTYSMYWNSSAKEVLSRFKKEYDAYWTPERIALAKVQGLTPAQACVLASIVEEESNKPDEYPKIASVYINRLRRHMKLQACPTVCYCYGYKLRRILNSHLACKSPYNTYLYEGLPPTPISVPGKEHLEAVLHPDKTPYLYFCADASMNGRNVFSKTFAEHNVKANAYRAALDNMKKSSATETDGAKSE